VFLALAFILAAQLARRYEPYTFIRRDASFYATITRGLVQGGTLDQRPWQPTSWYTGHHPAYDSLDQAWSNVSVGADGETLYPKHSYVMSALAVPFYAFWGPPGLLVFNALCVFLMLFGGFLLASRFAPTGAAVLAVVLALMSPKLVEQTYFFGIDPFTAGVVAVGFAALLRPRPRPALAGFLLGLALWARPNLALLVFPVGIPLAWGHAALDRGGWVRLLVAGAVPLVAAAVGNWVMFGAPWITSYDRILTVVDGRQVIQSSRTLFDLPFGEGLERMFTQPYNGLLRTSLGPTLGVLGLPSLWRRDRKLAVGVALSLLGYFAFFVTYHYQSARFFLPWEVALMPALAAGLDDAGGLVAAALGRLRGLAAVYATSRPRLAALTAGVAFVVVGVWGLASTHSGPYRLSDHVSEARVTRGALPCDYLNLHGMRWECSGLDRHGWEMTGLALRDDACRFDDHHYDMLWLHPPAGSIDKTMVFPALPRGPLNLTFGLADSASRERFCVEATYGATTQELCASRPGELQTVRLPAPPAGTPTSLRLVTRGPAHGRPHFCLDGTIADGRGGQPRPQTHATTAEPARNRRPR